MERREQRELSHDADQICLWRAALIIWFLFSILRFADSLAQIARMRAVEGLLDSFYERAVLRIIDDHGGPRDRLRAEPMTSNRAAKCKRKNRSAKSPHKREAMPSALLMSTTREIASKS
jgi:hypothetical protein